MWPLKKKPKPKPPRTPEPAVNPVPGFSPGSTIFQVRRARAGEAGAWGQLATKVHEVICRRVPLRAVPPGYDLDDLEQDVLVYIVRSLPDFDADAPGASFRGWIATVASRRLIDLWRRAKRGQEHVRSLADLEGADGEPMDVADDHWVPASTILHGQDLRAQIESCVQRLAADDRDLLRLHDEEGLSFPEIAARLGYDREGTARTRCFRARRRLRDLLQRCIDELDRPATR